MGGRKAMTLPFAGEQRMRYEIPPGGISLTGYIVRRLHKTALLDDMVQALPNDPALALAHFGIYCAAAATSWGPAYYQPGFDRPGTARSERDPDTGAQVTVRQLVRDPHYNFAFEITLPDGGTIRGSESITGTTVGVQGLGMPAPSSFEYHSADGSYQAQAVGIITSELAPRLFQMWQVRGYGRLQLSDSHGSRGALELTRQGTITARVTRADGKTLTASCQIA